MPKINAANLAEHREHTLTALLDAVDALAAERGVDTISLRDIAAQAGVARTAIYNYAPDKQALLVAASERATSAVRIAIGQIAEQREIPAAERLDRIVAALVTDFASSAQQIFSARALHGALSPTEREQSIAPFRDAIQQRLVMVLQDGVEDGSFRPDLNADLNADLVTGVLEAAVWRCLDRDRDAESIGVETLAFLRAATTIRQ